LKCYVDVLIISKFTLLIILLIKKCAFFDPIKLRQPLKLLIFAKKKEYQFL